MIAVVAGVLFREGRLMLCRRPEGKELAGKWEFPGGKLEEGESPEQALERELREELAIDVRVGRVIDVLRAQQGRDILLMFYRCDTNDEPDTQEGALVRFVEPQTAGEMDLAPMDRLFVQRGGVERALGSR